MLCTGSLMARFRYSFALIAFQLLCTAVSGQAMRCVQVEGRGEDSALGPVRDVMVTWPGGSARTDAMGRCEVPDRTTCTFVHVAFDTLMVKVTAAMIAADGCAHVELRERVRTIAEVTVSRAPERIFLRPDLHAADLWINDEGVWVLAYVRPRLVKAESEAKERILRDVRLVLLDTSFNERASCAVPEDVLGLRHDLHATTLLEGERHAFSVSSSGDGLRLASFSLDDLRHRVLPWTDSIPGFVLGSTEDRILPAFDHIAYDPISDSTRSIVTIVDTFMLQLFRSEYKYLKGPDKVIAMNLAAEMGVDKEIVAGYMSGFQHNIWFKPMYAPLFVSGDTLLVFDHANGLLRKFDHGLKERGSVPLSYLRKEHRSGWDGKVVQDRRTQGLFVLFKRNGRCWLRSIDPVSGSMGARTDITYRYPERLQVHDGFAYYVYRPSESLQKKAIYRERIR